MKNKRKYYRIERCGNKWMVFCKRTGFGISLEPDFVEALRAVNILYVVDVAKKDISNNMFHNSMRDYLDKFFM